jgi:hypothetical protein
MRRLVAHGHGFNPLGRPSDADLDRLRAALLEGGRDPSEVELVGGTRGDFPDAESTADLERAFAAVPAQLERGFRTICFKPSQFTDDAREVGALCRRAVAIAASMA